MAKEPTRRAPRKRYEDMTPEEKADYDRRNAPKPAYMTYRVGENGKVEVGLVTRDSDELLAAIDADRGLDYVRFEIK